MNLMATVKSSESRCARNPHHAADAGGGRSDIRPRRGLAPQFLRFSWSDSTAPGGGSKVTPFNLNYFIAYPQDRFNQVDWNLQKAKIEATALRYNDALIWPDATGVGDPVVEDLKSRGLRIGGENQEGFKFTELSRQNLLNNLAILLEQDKIKIPNDEGLIGELEAFRYELTDRGKTKVTVPEGMHDDRVMSLALSVWGIREPIRQDPYQVGRVYENRAKNRNFT